jgi:predicted RNA-binding Zn-ribbon protein involved in translation (DUF1610 family)
MSDHPWLQRLDVTAICPKCEEVSLRRSHTKTRFERFKREHSGMRIFRCQACGWRGWLDEAKLRYSNVSDSKPTRILEQGLDVIPDISLDTPERPSMPEKQHIPGSEYRSGSAMRPPTLPDPENGRSTHGTEHLAFPRHGLNEEHERLHDFEEDLKPHSQRESDEFHSHSRHKGKPCPQCGSFTLFRSRHRDWKEALRKQLTGKRPYRCHKCRWRGWLPKQL